MQQSESIAKLVTALSSAQKTLRNPALDSVHPHFKGFRYASLGAHIDALRSPLADHGIVVVQGIDSSGNAVSVSTTIAHSSGEWMRSTVGMTMAEKATAQTLGSCVTYLRRYSLAAMLMLTGEDDTDADEDRSAKQCGPSAPRGPTTAELLSPSAKEKTESWPKSGTDTIKIQRVVDRGDTTAILCAHPTRPAIWVSATKPQAGGLAEGAIASIEWRWSAGGFAEAVSIKKLSDGIGGAE